MSPVGNEKLPLVLAMVCFLSIFITQKMDKKPANWICFLQQIALDTKVSLMSVDRILAYT